MVLRDGVHYGGGERPDRRISRSFSGERAHILIGTVG